MPPTEPRTTDGPPQSRFSTRDLIGPTLLFVGGFLVAVTVALPTLFVDQVRTVGLDIDRTSVGRSAPEAEILDRCSLSAPDARVVGADLTRQQRVVAVRPADDRRVTLQAGTSIRLDHFVVDGRDQEPDAARPGVPRSSADEGSEESEDSRDPDDSRPDDSNADSEDCTDDTVTAVKDRVTIDRRTARPIPGSSGSEIQYDSRRAPVVVPDRAGYTYVLPFDAAGASGERSYYDPTTRRAVPLSAAGDTTIEGRDAVRFVAKVPDTDLNTLGENAIGHPPTTLTRPASWFGVTGGDPRRPLTAQLHHRGEVELAVDATTGVILDRRDVIVQEYRFIDPALAERSLTALSATFRYDTETRRQLADQARSAATPAVLWGRVIPIATGVLGAAALIAGLLLLIPGWRPGRRQPTVVPPDAVLPGEERSEGSTGSS